MRRVSIPHLGRQVIVSGRRRPPEGAPRLRLGRYLKRKDLPPVPIDCSYVGLAHDVLQRLFLNDRLGDCVIAGGYHLVGLMTYNAGDGFTASDQQIIADYGAIGGYNPANPSSDAGCNEQTALDYWKNHGFANGTKLAGWVSVDPSNADELRAAMFLFESLFFGIALPDAWISPFPSQDGFTWDVGPPDYNNGHCVVGVGYSPQGVLINTWGLEGTLTWAAIASLCSVENGGEVYALLSPDQILNAQSKAPNGLAWDDLLADFAQLGAMAPTPPPAPEPTTALSLTGAQSALGAGWPGTGTDQFGLADAQQALADGWPAGQQDPTAGEG